MSVLSLTLTFATALLACLTMQTLAQTYHRSPNISPEGFHRGMLIDAGSGGSRLHIYTWKQRVFKSVPPAITVPTTDEKWTEREAPGISALADTPEAVSLHLTPLIEYAKKTLLPYRDEWHNYPIFFKATGGMRAVPLLAREAIMDAVRAFMSDKVLCPFLFRFDFARVISGEEEGVYAWAGVNFLMGSLVASSSGNGAVGGDGSVAAVKEPDTWGVLDLGGGSTQIAFFVPSQDINEGLFKLQIGGQRHWNVYVKSFLQFGHVAARKRHLQIVADSLLRTTVDEDGEKHIVGSGGKGTRHHPVTTDPCFFSGYEEAVERDTTNLHVLHEHAPALAGLTPAQLYAATASMAHQTVLVRGPEEPLQDQLQQCMALLRPLLEKEENSLCAWTHDGQCSIGGAYQPALPPAAHFKFAGTSSYKYAWKFLMLPQTATLQQFQDRAEAMCSMTMDDVDAYIEEHGLLASMNDHMVDFQPYYCFMAAYNLVLLTDGYGFNLNHSLTVLATVDGNKVGWALGCMLYEINALPWRFDFSDQVHSAQVHAALLAGVLGVAVGLLLGHAGLVWEQVRKVLSEQCGVDVEQWRRRLPVWAGGGTGYEAVSVEENDVSDRGGAPAGAAAGRSGYGSV